MPTQAQPAWHISRSWPIGLAFVVILAGCVLYCALGCQATTKITGQSATASNKERSIEMSVGDAPKTKTVREYQVIVTDEPKKGPNP